MRVPPVILRNWTVRQSRIDDAAANDDAVAVDDNDDVIDANAISPAGFFSLSFIIKSVSAGATADLYWKKLNKLVIDRYQ